MTGRAPTSLPASYFDALYTADPDPWRFADSPYEASKYAATLAALPAARYGDAFEIGCSIGVFTRALAGRCERILAVDAAETALVQARSRLADLPQVRLARMEVPRDWPDACFDLIVLSEVLYYLDPADLRALAARLSRTLLPGGDVLLVHWTGDTDYPLSGDAAADAFIAATRSFAPVSWQHREATYRLDLLRRPASAG